MQRTLYKSKIRIGLIFFLLVALLGCNLPSLIGSSEQDPTVPGPVVAFQSPATSMAVALGEAFPVFVTASDPLGVSRIELWVGSALIMSQIAPEEQTGGVTPLVLSYSLVGAEAGTHSMIARAYNSVGVLGESLAVHVTVSGVQSAASSPIDSVYIAQAGDTIESIASTTNHSVGAVQQANPGSSQLQPGQHIAIPNQPGAPPPQQQAVNPPAGAQILPPLLPNQQAGAAAFAPGQSNQLAPGQLVPNLFPGFQPQQNALNPSLEAPSGFKASVSDCKVTINWQDNSGGKAGFTVYRRRVPDDPAPKIIANLKTNATSFIDTVPGPGEYEYNIEQSGNLQFMPSDQDFIQQGMLAAVRSAPLQVEVKPSTACIDDPDAMKHVHIEVQNVVLKHAVGKGLVGAAIWYSVNNSPGRRVPATEGQYHPSGSWNFGEEVVPITGAQYLNNKQPIVVKFWASGMDPSHPGPPENVGEAYNSHLSSDIQGKVDNYYVAENNNFKVEYRIWIEESKWTGQGTTNKIPAPENLRIQRTTASSRILTWDWTGDTAILDGYILYKSYSCPGTDTKIYAPQMIPSSKRQAKILFKSEPAGCIYQYKVSAFGRTGESAPSKPLHGDTENAYALANIMLSDLKFTGLPNGAEKVKVDFYVNQHRRSTTNAYWVYLDSFDLSKWVLGGRLPNNGFGVVLSEKEVLTIGFTVSGVSSSGHVAYGSVCSGASILPPVDAWKDDAWRTSIKSTDGSCELTVNLSGQKSTKAGSGGVVMPQADIAIRNVSLIGNQIFALVENDGPDPLVNNTVFVGGVFGYQCQDGSDTKWGWWNGPITHVQSNLPQLIHLSYYLDNEFMQWHTGVADFEEREGCEFGIFVIAQAPENEAKGEKPNYLDSNKTNNALFVPFDRILPVQ